MIVLEQIILLSLYRHFIRILLAKLVVKINSTHRIFLRKFRKLSTKDRVISGLFEVMSILFFVSLLIVVSAVIISG